MKQQNEMEDKTETLRNKRWTKSEHRQLERIGTRFAQNGVVDLVRVPLDMWPQHRTIGASCYQLTRLGYNTTGMDGDARKRLPAEQLEFFTGSPDLFTPKKRRRRKTTTTTTHSWFWGLYTKTVEQ